MCAVYLCDCFFHANRSPGNKPKKLSQSDRKRLALSLTTVGGEPGITPAAQLNKVLPEVKPVAPSSPWSVQTAHVVIVIMCVRKKNKQVNRAVYSFQFFLETLS